MEGTAALIVAAALDQPARHGVCSFGPIEPGTATCHGDALLERRAVTTAPGVRYTARQPHKKGTLVFSQA
jgi:hypothetical protein